VPDSNSATSAHVTVTVQLIYLARLRDAFGRAEEALAIDAGATVAQLLEVLRARGGAFALELAAGRAVRVAINRNLVDAGACIAAGDEVALLPPVTGG
jgi:sulfur-carrier protein